MKTIFGLMMVMMVCAAGAQGGVIYSENFDSATDGQSIAASPINWTLGQDSSDIEVNQWTALGDRALEGTSVDNNWYGSAAKAIGTHGVGDTQYILTNQVYVKDAYSTVWGMGSSSTGEMFGWYAADSNSWYFYITDGLRNEGGAYTQYFSSSPTWQKILTSRLYIDFANNQVWGELLDGTDILVTSAKHSVVAGTAGTIDNLCLWIDRRNGHAGDIALDDFVVTAVPEPATLGLLCLGGLFLRRK